VLQVRNLNVYYGSIQALRDISLDIQDGEFVTIIGNNGAGKTTLMMTLSGIVRQASGTIEFQGTSTEKLAPYQILSMGVAHVPQGRMLFPNMTVLENLELGSPRATDKKTLEERLEQIYGRFEILAKRTRQKAGTLSGGEQQMLTIARALMASPKLLMLDEPSSGLAPVIVQTMAEILTNLHKGGITILLVEQNARLALELADSAYVLENGDFVGRGTASELLSSDEIRRAYLGLGPAA
jgi:branched-chain amino acid transport system ATP-binding protein